MKSGRMRVRWPRSLTRPCLTLATLCTLATPTRATAAEPGDSPPGGQGLRKRGGYLTLAPGIITFSLDSPIQPLYGGGVMGMVHRIVGLGGEAAIDMVGSGGGAVGLARLRFFLALKF
jgi:hypothetical protein